jgi:4-hydroxybenzoate-CoA ligase
MFKSSGAWVSPVAVEWVLAEHPAVLEAAVVGKKNAMGLTKPMAYVVLRGSALGGGDGGASDAAALVAELKELCTARLPAYKRPEWIEILPELPRTATGKVQRFKLRKE